MKIITKILFVLLLGVSLAGCNLEEKPKGVIVLDDSIQSFNDLRFFRNGVYYIARSYFAPGNFVYSDMGVEYMDALTSFNNSYTTEQLWTGTSNTGDFYNLWAGLYVLVKHVNYFFAQVDAIENTILNKEGEQTQEDLDNLEFISRMKGEMYLFRATAEYFLIKFFCRNYDPATANTDLGIIISRVYDMTAQQPRASLEDSYLAVEADIDLAKQYLANYTGTYDVNEGSFTYDSITALEAKLYLIKGDYGKAADAAAELYGKYTLAQTVNDLNSLWINDTSSELIFSFYADVNEGGVTYGDPQTFVYFTQGRIAPNYIPSQWWLDLYTNDDIRKSAYFRNQSVPVGGVSHTLYIFTKYEGNPALRVDPNSRNYLNSVKLHRYAEILLIGAEACARDNNEPDANKYLNDLRSARIPSWNSTTYSGSVLIDQIKLERNRELAMEGANRYNDLKRWHEPMIRSGNSQTGNAGEIITITTQSNFAIPADDFRFIWPIPQAERNGNPNVIQNPMW